jgi:hypothetical protein
MVMLLLEIVFIVAVVGARVEEGVVEILARVIFAIGVVVVEKEVDEDFARVEIRKEGVDEGFVGIGVGKGEVNEGFAVARVGKREEDEDFVGIGVGKEGVDKGFAVARVGKGGEDKGFVGIGVGKKGWMRVLLE